MKTKRAAAFASPSEALATWRFELFVVLFSIYVLFEFGQFTLGYVTGWVLHADNLWHCISYVLAVAALLRPGSIWLMRGVSLAYVVTMVAMAPTIPNHAYFGMIIAILLFSETFSRQDPSAKLESSTFRKLVTLSLFALYFWTLVHKLNYDFFDPTISCVTEHLYKMQEVVPFFPVERSIVTLGIYGTIVVEATIALALLNRSWQNLALKVGIPFHLMLGFAYPAFTTLLFACFVWLLSNDELTQLRRRLGFLTDFQQWFAALSRWRLLSLNVAAMALALPFFYSGKALFFTDNLIGLFYAYGTLLCVFVFRDALLCRSWQVAKETVERPVWRDPRVVLPLVLVFFGAQPYLGLKNTQSFAMFSNLRTEGPGNNHLFIPAALEVSDRLDDLVRIRAINEPLLNRFHQKMFDDESWSGTYFVAPGAMRKHQPDYPQFHRLLVPKWMVRYRISELKEAGRKDINLVYETLSGDIVKRRNVEFDPELSGVSAIERKYWRLRAVPSDLRGYCLW